MKVIARGMLVGLALGLAFCGGCISTGRTSDEPVVASSYATGFETAKQVLLDYRFRLDRVDARNGVITTLEKPSAGFGSPWDREQSTTTQEAEELINQELRRVRIEFVQAGTDAGQTDDARKLGTLTPPNTPDADLTDLRTVGTPMRIDLTVTVLRVHRAGRQPSTMSIRTSNNYSDPALVAKGLAVVDEDLGRDEALESRLLAEIERRLTRSSEPPAATER